MPEPRPILLIDDDPLQREVMTVVLESEGWQVTAADSGEAALRLLRATGNLPPSVVLCDVQMPGLSGAELARELRPLLPAATSLLALTATLPAAAQTPPGYDRILLKPLDTAALEGAMAQPAKGEPAPQTASPTNVLSDLPVLDASTLARLAATMPAAALASLLGMATDDIAARLEKMRTAIATGDDATYRREAHSIKGSCGMIGAARLQRLAAREEQAGPQVSSESALAVISVELAALRLILERSPAGTDPSTP